MKIPNLFGRQMKTFTFIWIKIIDIYPWSININLKSAFAATLLFLFWIAKNKTTEL
jgi:hypothetical protein